MSSLFVQEDEDEEMVSPPPPTTSRSKASVAKPDSADIDDPVISEIPIILKSEPSGKAIHILQYPGRPSHRPFINENRVLESRTKPSTNLIEVDVPIEMNKFFDANKSEEWGGVNKQTLSGVLCDMDGFYIGNMQNSELVLVPIDAVAQIRPSLSYIDKEIANKREITRLDSSHNHNNNNTNNNNGNSSVQVVQMTVKSTTDTAPRLGGALMARKKVEEEDYRNLQWNDLKDEETERVREEVLKVENRQELESKMEVMDYLNMLVSATSVDSSN